MFPISVIPKRFVVFLLVALVIVALAADKSSQNASADEPEDTTEPAPDSMGAGFTDQELLLPESIGFRTENPGPFLHWPLPSSVPRTAISMLPDSPWSHNFLGISGCPSYPPMIDDYTWNGVFYPGQFDNYALPGTTRDRVRFLNVDNTGLLYNFFACYSASSSFGLPDHAGTDIAAANGTQVFATAFADQVYVVIDGNGDYRVRLRHPNVNGSGQTWYTFYVHLSSSVYPVGTSNVSISAGSQIGGVGQSHLHFQTAIGSSYANSEARNLWGIDQSPWDGCLWIDSGLCASPPSSCCGCPMALQSRQSATAVPPFPFAALGQNSPFTTPMLPAPLPPPIAITEVVPFVAEDAPEPIIVKEAVVPTVVPPDVTPPDGTLQIGGGGDVVNSLNVTLRLAVTDDRAVSQMRFSDDGRTWSAWEPFTTHRPWQLTDQPQSQTVYAQVKDAAGNVSEEMAAAVTAVLNLPPPSSTSYTVAASVMSMGGGRQTSGSYTVLNTIGQPYDTAVLHSNSYQVYSGFESFGVSGGSLVITRHAYLPVVTRP